MTQQGKVKIGLALAVLAGLIVGVSALTAYAQGTGAPVCDFTQMMGGMMGGNTPGFPQACIEAGIFGMGMMGGPMGRMGGMMMGGQGMMGMDPSQMGRFGPGTGMMGAWTPPADLAPAGDALTLDEAVKVAEAYIAAWDSERPLELGEVMQFDSHFYAEVLETATGRGAFEFLIDPTTGTVFGEPGPNMMWNLRYGMMGYGMGMGRAAVGGDEMTVSPEQARQYAQAYLGEVLPGAQVDEEVDTFYGYYTLHILRDGEIVGMLSVNEYTGQVWLHHWHGEFAGMTEFD